MRVGELVRVDRPDVAGPPAERMLLAGAEPFCWASTLVPRRVAVAAPGLRPDFAPLPHALFSLYGSRIWSKSNQ
jgi:hypothetical protein